MASLVPNGEQVFLDANGNPVAMGTVDMWIPGTVTPKVTWMDELKIGVNTQPIRLSSAGRAIIWGEGSYRQVLRDFAGNEIWDRVVTAEGGGSGNNTAIFNTVAEFKAASLSTAITAVIIMGYHVAGDGGYMRLQTVATEPTHPGKFFAHARHWEYAKMPYNVVMFDSQTNAATASTNAVKAAFAQRVVFSANSGTHILEISPNTDPGIADTPEAKGKLIEDAAMWASGCQMTGTAILQNYIKGDGEIEMWGQVILDAIGTTNMASPIVFKMDAPFQTAIVTVNNGVQYTERHKQVTHAGILGAGNGSGYITPPQVAFVGGGGTGAAGIAHIGQVYGKPVPTIGVIGITMTSNGEGYTSDPSVTFSGGGGTGAVGQAYTNAVIQHCLVRLQAWPTWNVVKGMPFAISSTEGTNDAGGVNGAHTVFDFNQAAKTLTFRITAPNPVMVNGNPERANPPIVASDENLSIVKIPKTWIKSVGGDTFTGAGIAEGLFSANGFGRTIELENIAAYFAFDSTKQARKRDQAFAFVGRDGGMFYLRNNNIAADWPGEGIRIVRGAAFCNHSHLGCGIYGAMAAQVQNGGWLQMSNCSLGSSAMHNFATLGGVSGYVNNSWIGAAVNGVSAYGGYCDWQVANIFSCFVGVEVSSAANTYCSSTSHEALIYRCTTGIDPGRSGQVIGVPNIQASISENVKGGIQLGTIAHGGRWMPDGAYIEPRVRMRNIDRVGITKTTLMIGDDRNAATVLHYLAGKVIFSDASINANSQADFFVYNKKIITTDVNIIHVQILGFPPGTGRPVVGSVRIFAATTGADPHPQGFIVTILNVGTGNITTPITITYTIDELVVPASGVLI